MAKKIITEGTLFMALEVGASWPKTLHKLRSREANFLAVVQDSGESAEHFAGRALERWCRLLGNTVPPHRFVLGTRANPDDEAVAARRKLAHGVLANANQPAQSELILWGGSATSGEEQGRLLELAGSLVGARQGSSRSVRVLFGDSSPFLTKATKCFSFEKPSGQA